MSLKRLDPLAQSFFVETPVFITKVDLFFAEKDDSLPVFMQIRKNQNGAPSRTVVNFSETYIDAANVNTSTNANVATTVTFTSPVFLDIGEYSLTLGSDSKDYKVYTSALNGTDITTSVRITEQPLVGSLFKSQNAIEWVASPFEDLKMKLYRAVFDTSVTGTINLVPGRGRPSATALGQDPLEVYPNSTIVKVYHFNHAMLNGSYIALRNVANANVYGNVGTIFGLDGNVIQDKYFEISNVKLDSYTIVLPSAVSGVPDITRFGGSGVYVTSENIGYSSITPQIPVLRPSNTNVTHKVITTTPSTGSSYTIDSAYNVINNSVENKFDTARVIAGLSNKIYKTSNAETLQYRIELSTDNDRVSPIVDAKQLGANFKRNLVNKPTYDTTVFGHEIATITANNSSNIYNISNTIGLIHFGDAADQSNARAIINGSYVTVTANINSGQYRVIDVLDSGANIRVAKLSGNIVTDANAYGGFPNTIVVTNSSAFIAEEAAEGGSAYSKYITRQVDFINPSTSIKFLLDVAKPTNADVEFYYKTKVAGDNTNFKDIEYTKVSNVTIATSLGGEFYEVSKQVDNIAAFNSLMFKIVFLSSDEAQIPRIKNLRIIALE